jgi:uncharacterized membrane protein YkgB
MNHLVNALSRSGLLKDDLDYLLIRASMVIVFLLFGYQKWFEYEAKVLIPYISNGPLISWMYPAFGCCKEQHILREKRNVDGFPIMAYSCDAGAALRRWRGLPGAPEGSRKPSDLV